MKTSPKIKLKKVKVDDKGVLKRSDALRGKRIALAVCGGIGAVEIVKVAREIRRFGAETVQAFFTADVPRFISALSVEWATGLPVVESVGAEVDHLEKFDLVIVAPATLNTISKCASALCDNPVTLLVASQFGRGKSVLFVPTMNQVLLRHPSYAEHRRRLESWGAKFLESAEDEGRLKMPTLESLMSEVLGTMAR